MKTIIFFTLPLLVLFTGCATQPMPTGYYEPGFFSGFFHGATLGFALVGSMFGWCRIYAFPNSGFLYDFGFFLGIGTLSTIFWTLFGFNRE